MNCGEMMLVGKRSLREDQPSRLHTCSGHMALERCAWTERARCVEMLRKRRRITRDPEQPADTWLRRSAPASPDTVTQTALCQMQFCSLQSPFPAIPPRKSLAQDSIEFRLDLHLLKVNAGLMTRSDSKGNHVSSRSEVSQSEA